MSECFFDNSILNVPSKRPSRHWELKDGSPTERLVESLRDPWLITPVPKAKKRCINVELWRQHAFQGILPFFCQTETAVIPIWLTELASRAQRCKTDGNVRLGAAVCQRVR